MAKTKPKDITMWAAVRIGKHGEWIDHSTVSRTRIGAKKLLLGDWYAAYGKGFHCKTWRLSKVNVSVK